MTKLNGQIDQKTKGLNDYLYDEQREREKVLEVKNNYQEAGSSDDDDDEEEEANRPNNQQDPFGEETQPKKFNKYDLIANSRHVQLYVIDKEAYLKNMLTFTSDKSVANKYLEKLVVKRMRITIKIIKKNE